MLGSKLPGLRDQFRFCAGSGLARLQVRPNHSPVGSRQAETDHLIGHSPKSAALAVGRIVLLRSVLSDAEDSLSVLKE
jgi:hypothetical protein